MAHKKKEHSKKMMQEKKVDAMLVMPVHEKKMKDKKKK